MTTFEHSPWNTDIDRAPKGRDVTIHRRAGRNQEPVAIVEFQPDYVLLMSECRKVIKSYWLPKEQRWAGFTAKERPLAWMHWPVWSEEIAAHALALRNDEVVA